MRTNLPSIRSFFDELEKISIVAPVTTKPDEHAGLKGVAALGGAAVAAPHIRPLATGRERLYHGTATDYAQKIRAEGLKPRIATSVRGITEVIDPAAEKASRNLAFATPSKFTARTYAAQAQGIKENLPSNMAPAGTPQAARQMSEARQAAALKDPKKFLKRLMPWSNEGIVKMDVPTWKLQQEGKLVANPEALGSYDEFRKAMKAKNPFVPEGTIKATHRSLTKKTRAIKGGIGTEHIVGHPGFKRLGLKEIGQYARVHPGRFGAGLALGAGALTAGAYGAHKLYQSMKRKPEVRI